MQDHPIFCTALRSDEQQPMESRECIRRQGKLQESSAIESTSVMANEQRRRGQ